MSPRQHEQPRRQFSSKVLRVAKADWPLVKRGLKTEYRHRITDKRRRRWHHKTPAPVVLGRQNVGGRQEPVEDFVLAVLEAHWFEPLGAISEESLRREGFDSFAAFRRYWVLQREFGHRKFSPEDQCVVFRIRLARTEGEIDECGRLLLARLYGPWLPELCEGTGIYEDEEKAE